MWDKFVVTFLSVNLAHIVIIIVIVIVMAVVTNAITKTLMRCDVGQICGYFSFCQLGLRSDHCCDHSDNYEGIKDDLISSNSSYHHHHQRHCWAL